MDTKVSQRTQQRHLCGLCETFVSFVVKKKTGKFVLLLIPLLLCTTLFARQNPFDLPERFDTHNQLRMQLIGAIQQKNYANMEAVARRGVAALPEDPIWHYNLACALALQKKDAQALAMLDKAVEFGFADAALMEADDDLVSLREKPEYKRLLERVANAKPVVEARLITEDFQAEIARDNTIFDFESGLFRSFFAFPEKPEAFANEFDGASAERVRAWIADGAAAGSFGVLYDNRDGGHSQLAVSKFPGLARVIYGNEPRERNLHQAGAMFMYNAITVGNSSLAMTEGPYWRGITRMLNTDTRRGAQLFMQYNANHVYVYPSHHDYLADRAGDTFAANCPYVVTSMGSSGSDQPFVNALLSTLAAFPPDVRGFLARSNRIAPTLHMMLRSTQKHLASPEDYLTGRAHRPVLNGADLDAEAMVAMANAMTTNTIPPLVFINFAGMNPPPARLGADFFDHRGDELIVQTPALYSMVMRGPAEKRAFTFAAGAIPPGVTDKMEFRWVVLQGDPALVEIKTLNAVGSAATLTLTHPPVLPFPVDPEAEQPLMTSRVDVGVFVNNGTHWSPPAIMSFYYLPNEERMYDANGRLQKVDYAKAVGNYADPVLSLPKRWIDVLEYDDAGNRIGWERWRGNLVDNYTADGFKVLTRDIMGRPATARVVEYIPRSGVGSAGGIELSESETTRTVTYSYATPADKRGTFKEAD